ncbi:hypothetical protein HYPSUDRAFT_200307 [Hypholoma sublateritium FD-334 SS-4]|uniref:Uncharacterized protein n=1 Tax=Hypholoma sublateritium (strain FD-334 SS-4) TaxID=945553 RepID=A0A0D2P7Z8_HYPSF|nr:hypothetical protein HYPSUDRAFT_200307 [Hypholoma sublateritium FD-334 SS-4]
MRYDILDFVDTAQCDPPLISHPICAQRQAGLARDWREYQHPLGHAYFYNATLRILTTEDLRNPEILQRLLTAHTARIACDPLADRLPTDAEFVIADGAVRDVHSRLAGVSYHFDDDAGLSDAPKAAFWAHMAAFPAHSRHLPPHTESAFVRALDAARARAARGVLSGLADQEIHWISEQYRGFLVQRQQGMNVTALLSWLIGVVMPQIGPVGGSIS